ncbi:hypothetical protein ABIE67_009403 [Streptomyces sp. V4I8]|uniref:hypothetical protein n=1 Tax=Streptomyces sp. V4I8 TaxID=3156469 RepID=UPI00351762F8
MTGSDRVRSVALIPHPEGTLALAVSWADGGTDVLDFATGSVSSLKGARAKTVAAYLSDQGRSVLITGEQDAVVGRDVRTGDEVFCLVTGNRIEHVGTDTSSGRPILIVGSVNGVALLDLP